VTKFTDEERAYLVEMRAISTDANGKEVLVGLHVYETAFYMDYARSYRKPDRDPRNRDKYLMLHEKHQLARLQVIGAEHHVRMESPIRHLVTTSSHEAKQVGRGCNLFSFNLAR
jgi:hypothetical protein